MVTIWGRATSSNVQAAMWAAAEVGLEVERIDVGGKYGGTDTPAYRAMNPNGLIPVLKDGDLVMFESSAILRYLAARYGDETFWPSDPVIRARLDTWAEWVKTTLCPVLVYRYYENLAQRPAYRDHVMVDYSSLARS
jgi:glutathione S-transferase